LKFTGTFTQISNIRWYTGGTLGWDVGTGGYVSIGYSGGSAAACPSSAYDQATGTPGTSGDDITTHLYFPASGDAFDVVSGSPLTVNGSGEEITVSGYYSKCVVTQVGITSDATSGTQTAEQYTWLYDEIS
jgi:hypothetical protein